MTFNEQGGWEDTPCDICTRMIPKEKMQKKKKSQKTFTCSRECEVIRRSREGWYKAWSVKGHDARVVAVTISNRKNPRRQKKRVTTS